MSDAMNVESQAAESGDFLTWISFKSDQEERKARHAVSEVKETTLQTHCGHSLPLEQVEQWPQTLHPKCHSCLYHSRDYYS